MTGSDPADQGEGFLARWSQRKQDAKRPDPQQDSAVRDDPVSAKPPPAETERSGEPEFDLSTLPKLEELTESTDITAFLRKGVPEHLRNAALRKSWALDPAIRNYVSPALEYAYDWNTPGGVPGNGELEAGIDIARMVAQIMGGSSAESARTDAASGDNGAIPPAEPSQSDPSVEAPRSLPVQSLRRSDPLTAEMEDFSRADAPSDDSNTTQFQASEPVAPQNPVRRHGTAKPIV
jgi:hypothetical protein